MKSNKFRVYAGRLRRHHNRMRIVLAYKKSPGIQLHRGNRRELRKCENREKNQKNKHIFSIRNFKSDRKRPLCRYYYWKVKSFSIRINSAFVHLPHVWRRLNLTILFLPEVYALRTLGNIVFLCWCNLLYGTMNVSGHRNIRYYKRFTGSVFSKTQNAIV